MACFAYLVWVFLSLLILCQRICFHVLSYLFTSEDSWRVGKNSVDWQQATLTLDLSYFCMGNPLTTVNKRHWIRVIRCMTTNSKRCMKWRSLQKDIRGLRGYFMIREWAFIFLWTVNWLIFFVIRELKLSSWIVKSVLFSLWIGTQVLFFAYPLTWEIQIRRNRKRKCVQMALFKLFKIHTVCGCKHHTHTCTWSQSIVCTENLGCLFSKWQSGVATLE